ncbi:MAG: hypothetical protein ACLGI8_06740 [Acidimicrobiia bacterium]|jgi:hypothetical protein
MPSLTSLLRALGNERAVANASALLESRRREDWLVAGLARRLDRHEGVDQATSGGDSGVAARTAI